MTGRQPSRTCRTITERSIAGTGKKTVDDEPLSQRKPMERIVRALTSLPPIIGLAGLLLLAMPANAQTLSVDLGNQASMTSQLVQIILLLTVLTLAPSILVMVTSFTRIVIVLSLLRTALGLQQSPPNSVLISLSLFLTLFIMAPTLERAWEDGVAPLLAEEIDEMEAFERSAAPVREFMLANVRGKDLDLFFNLADITPPEDPLLTPLRVIVPSYMISELRRAFEIGFLIFVPFLIIDMVIASVLMSMGMMMLPPVVISLPFKLIFFVLVDGWFLLAGSLVQSFATDLNI
jgi:flagellar biosynthetic protein FliP